MKIAFAGEVASGKAFAAEYASNKLDKMKETYIIVHLQDKIMDPEQLCTEVAKVEAKHIIIDNVRNKNQVIALQHCGFKVFYMHTPWQIRFQRIQKRYQLDGPTYEETSEWFTPKETVPLYAYDNVIIYLSQIDTLIDTATNQY